MSGGVLVRVPVADLDETFLGLEVLVTRPAARVDLPGGAVLSIEARTVAGGLSDVERTPERRYAVCPHPEHAVIFPPRTRLWVGGEAVSVGDDAVILAAPPASLLDALAAASP